MDHYAGRKEIRQHDSGGIQDQLRPDGGGPEQTSMINRACATLLTLCLGLHGETMQERGKRVVNECLQALGGDRYMNMQTREIGGRAYSFYREQLSGQSLAKIYT